MNTEAHPGFELQPTLVGEKVMLRPLQAEDWDELFAAGSDPAIWEQHPAKDRYTERVFRAYFDGALACGGAFVVVDHETDRIIGSTRFDHYDAELCEIEVGWTFLARPYWGRGYNAEMKRLMLEHAFRFVDRVVLHVGVDNIRSRTAVERIGGVEDATVDRLDDVGRPWSHVRYVVQKPA